MQSDFIIIPVFNRSAYTLDCLQNLKSIGVLEKFSVIVVDDGSTDDTAARVKSVFSEVILLQGSGSLYWTGAIEMGMRYAMELGAESLVWLNDDSRIMPGVIDRLVFVAREKKCIASALGYVHQHTRGTNWYFPATYKTKTGLSSLEIKPDTGLIPVDACRGNLVAISRAVVEMIGFPDGKRIPHVAGDSDYTLRATRHGFPCLVLSDVLLEEVDTIQTGNHSWLLGEESVAILWKQIFMKRNSFYPPMRMTYLTRHWGWRGFLQFPIPYLKLAIISVARYLLPRSFLFKIYASKSHAWQATAWSRGNTVE